MNKVMEHRNNAAPLFVQLRICILILARHFSERDLLESFHLNQRMYFSLVSNACEKNHQEVTAFAKHIFDSFLLSRACMIIHERKKNEFIEM